MTSPCAGCFLRNRVRVPFVGPEDAPLAVVGEAPAHNEVREKTPFSERGQSGAHFSRLLSALSIPRRALRVGNALLCGPVTEDEKKLPEFHDALTRCRERREAEGDLGAIRHVLALGTAAGEGLTGEKIIYGGRQPRRGALIIDAQGRYITTSWHPAAMLRAGGDTTKGGKKGGGGLSDAEVEILATDIEKAWKFALGQRQPFVPDGLVTLDPAAFGAWIREWTPAAKRVSVDVETDSVDPTKAQLLIVGLAVTDAAGAVHAVSFWWPAADEAVWTALRELLARRDLTTCYHNCQYDVSVLTRIVGPIFGDVYDTLLGMHAAFPEVKLDLGSVSQTFLIVPAWKYYFRAWERAHKKDVEARTPEWVQRNQTYNLWDTACTEAAVPHIEHECEDRSVSQIAKLDTRLALVARKMTERGLLLSQEVREEISTELRAREAHAAEKLQKLVVDACNNALAAGMRVDLVEKLMLLVQKSSNKSLPKARWRKVKKVRKGRRRKKLSAAAQAVVDALTAASAAAVAAAVSSPVIETGDSPFDDAFITAHNAGGVAIVVPADGCAVFVLPGSGPPPEGEATMGVASPSAPPSAETQAPDANVDWLRSLPTGTQVDADGHYLWQPPVPDKVWTNKAWNPFSQDQLRLAFDIAGVDLPAGALTKKGQRSLSKHVLVQVFEHPIVGAVIELRKYRRLLSVYFESKGVQLGEDGRLRVGWKVHGTPTGRWSSGAGGGGVGDIGIAVQNWPTSDIPTLNMRRMVIAPPGYKLVAADYSQLEMRIAAVLSGETALLDVFNDRTGQRDMHSENAARLYGATWQACDPLAVVDPIYRTTVDKTQLKLIQKLKDQKLAPPLIAEQLGRSEQGILLVLDYAGRRKLIRKFTKTGIYAAFYGAIPPTVQSQLRAMSLKEPDPKFARMLREVSLKQCQMFVDAVPRMWPKFSRWRTARMNDTTGIWVCPWSGRRRVWPMGRSDGPQAVNTPVQMGAASAMNDRFLAFAAVMPEDVYLILQVHDSIGAEAPEAIADDVKKLMVEKMEMTLTLGGHSVWLAVEAAVGDSWDRV